MSTIEVSNLCLQLLCFQLREPMVIELSQSALKEPCEVIKHLCCRSKRVLFADPGNYPVIKPPAASKNVVIIV